METRIAWSVVFGCALVLPSACSRGTGVGFTSFGPGAPGQNADDDEDDQEGDEEADDGAVSTSGPSVTTGPLTSSTDPGPPPDEGPPGPMGTGDCCLGHGGLGCDDVEIESCVCAQDDFCCTMKWDDLCVSLVAKLGCGTCGDAPPQTSGASMSDTGGIDPSTSGSGGDVATTGGVGEETGSIGGGACCMASGSPGCADAEIEACVCAQDDYCCDAAWDSLCVDEVEDFACGSCGGAGESTGGEDTGDATTGADAGVGDCCTTHGPGCSAPAVETCVCSEDAYCCDTAWDSLCVSEVDEFGCGACP